jgi:hypothetical protein
MSRPSEAITATVGSILGAFLIVVGWVKNGADFTSMTTEVSGALTLLVSWIPVAVTWFIAQRQRRGELSSLADGSVET